MPQNVLLVVHGTVKAGSPPACTAVHPAGIPHVIVNGTPAVLDGRETGDRPGRLLRKAG